MIKYNILHLKAEHMKFVTFQILSVINSKIFWKKIKYHKEKIGIIFQSNKIG